jgi:hypothetical protein
MDLVNFDALKAQGRIIRRSDVDPEEDYFILGHYDPRRREFKATDYPIYAIKAGDVLGPILSNTDRQFVQSSATISTTNSLYIDLPGMSVTTTELGTITSPAQGNYQVHFSASYSISDVDSSANFILNVDGADITPSEILENPITLGQYRTSMIWQLNSLPVNSIIKIRFKINPFIPGTSAVSVFQRSLMVNGVNTTLIV